MPVIPEGFESPDGSNKVTNAGIEVVTVNSEGGMTLTAVDAMGGMDVPMINQSTIAVEEGDVVLAHETINNACRVMIDTDVASDRRRVIGVIVVGGAVGASVKLRLVGVGMVKVNGDVSRGDVIVSKVPSSGESGAGAKDNSPLAGTSIAKTLDSKGDGIGTVKCLILCGVGQ